MRLFFFFLLFFLVGCMDTPEVSSLKEEKNIQKILGNQTEAQKAKEEYRQLQKAREQNR